MDSSHQPGRIARVFRVSFGAIFRPGRYTVCIFWSARTRACVRTLLYGGSKSVQVSMCGLERFHFAAALRSACIECTKFHICPDQMHRFGAVWMDVRVCLLAELDESTMTMWNKSRLSRAEKWMRETVCADGLRKWVQPNDELMITMPLLMARFTMEEMNENR